ncbi:MAG: hypothetical protein K6T17_00375 [Fimbriimonadales bacterium]|nr:hypothetical protein [Fimbriimonadales bacterium]
MRGTSPLVPMPPSDHTPSAPLRRVITLRAIAGGVLCCIPVTYWNAWQPVGTIYSLLFSTMGMLIVLVFINHILHRFNSRWAFTSQEMIVMYGMFSVASAISGEWTFLNTQYIHVYSAFKDRDPLYSQIFLKYIPEEFYFLDGSQLRDYVAGGFSRTYFLTRLDIWLPRILMWTLLYGLITVALLCVNYLMRDAWLRRERLSYPLIQLPVALMEDDGRGGLWKSKLFWGGFFVMLAIDLLNGFQFLYPNLPSIPVKQWIDLGTLFPDQPWASLGYTPLALYPFIAALALFMPSDLLFSVIVFFILRKLMVVTTAAYGMERGTFGGGFLIPEAPYLTEQSWGAIFGLFATALWVARGYLREVAQKILAGTPAEDGGISHRTAFILFLLSSAGVLYFLNWSGLPFLILIPYFLAFVLFSFVITRMRAQLGPPSHEFAFMGPNQLLMNFYGMRNIPERAATILATLFFSINRLSRSHPMPVQLEAMKIADQHKVSLGGMFWLLGISLFLGAFLGMMWMVQRGYVRGADPGWGDPVVIVKGITQNPVGPNITGMAMVLVGFLVVTGLDALRFRIPQFPLHPVGYALSLNFGVDYYWFGLLIALIVKGLVLRYYGLRGFRQLKNVAFGILVAEFTAELLWASVAMITRQSTYTIGYNERGLYTQ